MGQITMRAADFDITELDLAWIEFLQNEVSSLSRWDCLRYFLDLGESSATLDQIALASGRESDTLLDDLGALTSAGWLVRRRNWDGETVYQPAQAEDRQRTLDTFHTHMESDTFRLKVLYQWTRGRSHDADVTI
ncbi:MAG: hypothetical protein WAU31_03460 [Candidatus Moraniibacteriota bacterium]